MDHYKKTQQFFNTTAIEKKGFYDSKHPNRLKHNPYQIKIREKVLQFFNKLEGKNVLDIGCGNGDFTILLAKKYPDKQFLGVDFSTKAIQLAKNNSRKLKNIKFITGNLLNLNLKNKSFDTVLCINTLHHITPKDLKTALKELSQISRKHIIIEIKNKNNFYYKYLRTGFGTRAASVDKGPTVHPTNIKIVERILAHHYFHLVKSMPLWHSEMLSPLIVLHFQSR